MQPSLAVTFSVQKESCGEGARCRVIQPRKDRIDSPTTAKRVPSAAVPRSVFRARARPKAIDQCAMHAQNCCRRRPFGRILRHISHPAQHGMLKVAIRYPRFYCIWKASLRGCRRFRIKTSRQMCPKHFFERPRAPYTLLKASRSALNIPGGRDVLLCAERATFYTPVAKVPLTAPPRPLVHV